MDVKCFVFGIFLLWKNGLVLSMNTQVSHFEHLNYDVHDLQEQHDRVRQSTNTGTKPITFKFQSHGRNFNLRLVRDTAIFHPDAVIETSSGEEIHHSNMSHIYHGSLVDVKGSYVHGSIIGGIFRGVIDDPVRGKYYVEENTVFFGARAGHSPLSGYRGHSVMYHQDTVKLPEKYQSSHQCAGAKRDIIDRMTKFQKSYVDSSTEDDPKILKRRKRQINQQLNTCLLFIQTDFVLYEEYENTEIIISKIAEHVRAANRIYGATNFKASNGESFIGLNFKVRRIRVNQTDSRDVNPPNPYRSRNIGVERFLDLLSLENHDAYCLSYIFTTRDFDNGVLGLAWVGTPSGSSGGICERRKVYSDGSAKSLNTGIVTFTNYGSTVPSRVSHITFAHEMGHNFGSPHDSGSACTPGETSFGGFGTGGNYIMYARATSGTQDNNDAFSPCSIRNISLVLEAKKDRCFVPTDQPLCGNQIVEGDEECDCGFPNDCEKLGDTCCEPANAEDRNAGCRLKANKQCSLTQGSCCETNCEFSVSSKVCANSTDCQFVQQCSGSSAACPAPGIEPNNTLCRSQTQVCVNGECSGSICINHTNLEPCECQVPEGTTNRSTLCHTCCRRKDDDAKLCLSTGDPLLTSYFENGTIFLQPGSACNDFNGYCDVFSNCRLVDADGPLSRLKQAIFNPELYSNIKRWIIDYWWAVLLMSIALLLLMVGFIKICSVHTPTHNPKLPKHKQFPGANTLRRRARANPQGQQHPGVPNQRSRGNPSHHEMRVK